MKAAVAGLIALAVAAPAAATPTCTAPSRLVQWPAPAQATPLWEFCLLTPRDSTGSSGSGVELHDVFYNGHRVFKRAHAPILNVKYVNGCTPSLCFRDWSDQEVRFEAGITAPAGSYADVSSPPITVCESGHGVDVGSFLGVAAERLSDRIILTSQMSAGWYRYTMKWALFADGRIDGWFGFSAVTHNCVNFDHTHHNYWRLDFDIDGAADDAILIGPPPDVPLPPGPLVVQGAEAARAHSPALTWMVKDMGTGRGYRLLPGPTEVVDEFSVADVWLMRYNANEITDAGQSGPACAIKFNNFVNQQALEEEDVVMWVRGGAFHAAGDLDDCQITSFTLQPAGDWSPSPPGAPVAAPRPGTR